MRDEGRPDDGTIREGVRPSDTERLVGDTAASEPLKGGPRVQPGEAHARGSDPADAQGTVRTDRQAARDEELGHS